MLCPAASPVDSSSRTKSRLPAFCVCTSASRPKRLVPATTAASSAWRARSERPASTAATAPSASSSTERVIRSSTTAARMPPQAIDTRAPRATEGHSGDS